MEPARSIIQKLGGVSVVAGVASVHRTRVSNWMRPREAGGTGGAIPFKHVPSLLAHAAAQGVELSVEEFLPRAALMPSPDALKDDAALSVRHGKSSGSISATAEAAR